MKIMRLLLPAALYVLVASGVARADSLHLLAAGSLREVLTEIGKRYHAAMGIEITAAFGPSGLLRERIEKGEKTDLFASADMGHPLKLLADGRAVRVAMFTRNALCGIALPKTGLTTANFLDRLLDPAVKLGTSTPKADPGGDYTWVMFHRADAVRAGSFATLDKKADMIVGGPTNNAPQHGRDPVVAGLSSGKIDMAIGYCSGRKRLEAQLPEVQFIVPPREIATGPEYGLAVIKESDPHTG